MAGNRSRRTVLFVPGIPGGPATWEPLENFLPASARLIYWPLERWQAKHSDASVELARLETALYKDIAAIAGPVTLVGHSFGAWLIARALSKLDPESSHAVLFGGMPHIATEHQAIYLQMATDLRSATASQQRFVDTVRVLMLDQNDCTADDNQRIRQLIEIMQLSRIGALFGLAAQLANERFYVTPYDVPTDIVHASNDRAMPAAYADELARLGSRARQHIWDGNSHVPHWYRPEASTNLISAEA